VVASDCGDPDPARTLAGRRARAAAWASVPVTTIGVYTHNRRRLAAPPMRKAGCDARHSDGFFVTVQASRRRNSVPKAERSAICRCSRITHASPHSDHLPTEETDGLPRVASCSSSGTCLPRWRVCSVGSAASSRSGSGASPPSLKGGEGRHSRSRRNKGFQSGWTRCNGLTLFQATAQAPGAAAYTGDARNVNGERVRAVSTSDSLPMHISPLRFGLLHASGATVALSCS